MPVKKKKAKGPGGAPTKYKKEYCRQIVDYMSTGKSLVAFAASIDVHKDTVYEWAKVHKEFSDSLKKAQAKCEAHWEKIGEEAMFMGGKDSVFIPSLYIFKMKARFGWSDKQEVEHSVKKPIRLTYNLDDDEE